MPIYYYTAAVISDVPEIHQSVIGMDNLLTIVFNVVYDLYYFNAYCFFVTHAINYILWIAHVNSLEVQFQWRIV